jgi:hypothetical protein
VSNSYLTAAANVIASGIDKGLTREETEAVLLSAASQKRGVRDRDDRSRVRGLGAGDVAAAAEFDWNAAGVPPELGGFGYGNGGEDIEFGVDQADWQIAQADDKDIVAKNLRRAQQAAKDIGVDARMRGGDVIDRNAVMAELARERFFEQNPDGRTDWRMQHGPRTVQGEARIPFLNPVAINDGRLVEDPFLKGKRGPDHNLLRAPEKQVRFMGRVDRDREGNFLRVRHPHRDHLEEPRGAGVGNQNAVIDAQVRLVQAVRRGEVSAQEAGALIEKLNVDLNPRGGRGVKVRHPGKERELKEARILMAQNPRVHIAPTMDGALLDPVGAGNVSRLGQIQDIGNLKAKVPAKAGGFNEGQYFPEARKGSVDVFAPYGTDNQGAHFDAGGTPLGVQGPVPANSVDPGQVANAPRDVRQWAVQNAPNFKEGGRIFGDFPQVDIGGAGGDFLDRVGRIKAGRGKGAAAFEPGVSAIRNISDLQAVVDNYAAFQQENGIKAFHLDSDNNEVYVDRAGLPELFQKIKMNENGQGRLANALFQLEAAKANGVNNEQRVLFEQGLDQFGNRGAFADVFAPNLVNGGSGVANIRIPQAQVQFGAQLAEFGNDEAQLQKIPRGAIQVGVDAVGEPIEQEKQAALQALSGRQAQPPLDANELRDVRNGLVGLVQGEGRGRESVFGFAKQIPTGAEPRAFFREQAIERAKPGKQPNFARVRENADRWQRIFDREKAARNAPNEVLGVMQPGEVELRRKEEMIKEMALRRDNPAAAGGAGMGGGNRPTAVASIPSPDPWETPPATGPGITEEVQRRTSSGPAQGPVPGSARKQFTDKANFIAKSPRMRTARRVGYGGAGLAGVAGLAALIGGESDRREQEAQY